MPAASDRLNGEAPELVRILQPCTRPVPQNRQVSHMPRDKLAASVGNLPLTVDGEKI